MALEHDSPPGSSPPAPKDPDRAVKWLLSVVLVGVAINLLSSAIQTQRWAWLPPVLFTLAAVTVVPRTGLLRREPHAGTRWTRLLARALLLAYLAVAIWGATSAWPLPVMILATGFLWATCVLVTWPTLRTQRNVSDVAWGVALLLAGVALLLIGVAALLDGHALLGVAVLLAGVAGLLFGVATLLDGNTLFDVAFPLIGAALLLIGVARLLDGHTLLGVALLLGGVAMLLTAIASLLDGHTLLGVAGLLAGIALLLAGVAILLDGNTLLGLAGLLGGVAICGSGATLLVPNQGQGVTLLTWITQWLTQRS